MITKAKASEIEAILKITRACTNDMISKDIYQWNDSYPSKESFLKDLNREELYVLKNRNKIIGCVTLSFYMDAVYLPVKWLTPTTNNLYIHRLAIHPDHQNNGHAKKLMEFAEHLASKHNSPSIRLDTFSKNERNQKFYEKRGYQRLESIYFSNQSTYSFYCYELVLS